jgi:hypothetical protein
LRPVTPGYPVAAKIFEKALADIANGADVEATLDAATDEIDAKALLAGDPFAKVGLFSASEVKPWRRTFGATL